MKTNRNRFCVGVYLRDGAPQRGGGAPGDPGVYHQRLRAPAKTGTDNNITVIRPVIARIVTVTVMAQYQRLRILAKKQMIITCNDADNDR